MKKKSIAIILCLSLLAVSCLSFGACFGLTPDKHVGNNGNSGNEQSGSQSNNVKEESDGTFIYTGSSIKAANTSISGEIIIPKQYNGTSIDTIPANAFSGCNGITSIVVPESITTIGEGAFNGCSTLKSITLPFIGRQKGNSGVAAACFGYIFGEYHFSGSTKLRQFYADYSYQDYYAPSTLRTVQITNESVVGQGAFQDCSMLTRIDLNDDIVQVGIKAFAGCSKISEINLPNITILSSSLFSGCISLTSFTIGSSVDTIEASAFAGCCNLSSINSTDSGVFVIPNAVTTIGVGAFNGCSLVKSITLPFIGRQKGNSGVAAACFGYIFGEYSFSGSTKLRQFYADYSYQDYYAPSALRAVKITNESVVGQGAFQDCSMLTSIIINGEAQTQIGKDAFKNAVKPTWGAIVL